MQLTKQAAPDLLLVRFDEGIPLLLSSQYYVIEERGGALACGRPIDILDSVSNLLSQSLTVTVSCRLLRLFEPCESLLKLLSCRINAGVDLPYDRISLPQVFLSYEVLQLFCQFIDYYLQPRVYSQ